MRIERIEGILNSSLLKFLVLALGFLALFNFQISTSKAEASTTITMDQDIRARVHDGGKTIETNGQLTTKKLKFVNIDNRNDFHIKDINSKNISLPNGTYNVYDITALGDNEDHSDLIPGSWIKVDNGTISPSIILFNYYRVTFDQGENVTTVDVLARNKVPQPADPSKNMHKFVGWVDENGEPFDFNERIYNPTKITAKWEKKKYAIVVVAGQSNAVGLDESPVDSKAVEDMMDPRINQLGFYGEDNLQVIPLGHSAQNFQDVRSVTNPANPTLKGPKGIHLPLGHLLLPYIPDDYELVIIPAAYGAANFTQKSYTNGEFDPINLKQVDDSRRYNWGTESAYYKALKARLQYLLDHNEDNYYIGTIWCQAEFDKDSPEEHFVKFKAMTEDFFSYFNDNYPNRVSGGKDWSEDQWFIYETVPYWSNISSGIEKIFDNYESWSPSTYVSLDFGDNPAIYTNETNGTKLASSTPASHFGNDAYSTLVAPAVVAKMLEAGAIEATE